MIVRFTETTVQKLYLLEQDMHQSLKMMVASVSHDMINPVGAIIRFADLLIDMEQQQEDSSNPMRPRFLKMMKSSAHLALCRMKDLLAKDMIEKNVFKKEFVEFEVKTVIEDLTEIM